MSIKERLQTLVDGKSDKISGYIDTAIQKVNEKTDGKHADRLESTASKVKDKVIDLDRQATARHTIDGEEMHRSDADTLNLDPPAEVQPDIVLDPPGDAVPSAGDVGPGPNPIGPS